MSDTDTHKHGHSQTSSDARAHIFMTHFSLPLATYGYTGSYMHLFMVVLKVQSTTSYS